MTDTPLHTAIREVSARVQAENIVGDLWATERFAELMLDYADAQAAMTNDERIAAVPSRAQEHERLQTALYYSST